jgi:hypothetical protein
VNILQNLMGGGQQQQDYQQFVNRYEQGQPSEGYSDQEVVNRYNQVATQLPPQQYMQAAEAAFARMTPEQRQEFGQYMQQQAQANNLPIGQGGNYEDPRQLAQITTQMHQQQPGMLSQLLGGALGGGSQGGMGGMLGGMLGGSGGQQGGVGGMLSNPVAKAALAGIAAMAAKQFFSQRH